LQASAGELAGFAAGILNTCAAVPYVISILRGKTKPHRASWLIWTIVGIIAAWSYYESGARQTMWFALTYVTNPLIALIFSIKYGEGGWSADDRKCLLGAAASLGLWYVTQSSLVGLIAILVVDFFGAIPTIRKVLERPWSEDWLAWTIATVAGVVNLFGLERWTFNLALQPLYFMTMTGINTGLI
jgi:hypothetical protein